jgi:hypothetical protein
MTFDYNTTRSELILAEYGRNVQNMVAYIKTLKSKEERNKYAQAVIDLMGFLNPHLRDVADFKHKLWDHLHIISNYELDVDSPYPKPDPASKEARPEPLAYPHQKIKYKHYGKTVEKLIETAIAEENPERKAAMVRNIANFMKISYVQWNKDNVSDEVILNNLSDMSGGQLSLDENVNLNKVEFKSQNNNNRQGGKRNNNHQNGKKNFKKSNKQRY